MRILLLAASLAVAGCQSVPQTEISWPTPAGTVSIKSPKQVSADKLTVTATTNGQVSVSLEKFKSENDSAVLAVVANSNAEITKASLQFSQDLLKQLAAAAASAAVKSAVPAP